RRLEAPGSPSGERPRAIVDRRQLGPVPVCVLEVIAELGFELDQALVVAPLDPRREALVQLRATLLRQRLVGGVANERVAERETALARQRHVLAGHELLAHERIEGRVEPSALAGRRE